MTCIHGHAPKGKQSKTYSAWLEMKRRCNDPTRPSWENYGRRGINYSPSWEVFENFLADMGEVPEGLTLERKNNNKGYCKENCVWADRRAQSFNRRVFKNNSSGITGVTKNICYVNGRYYEYWSANASPGGGKTFRLYHGKDFFEACCARKSWEAKNIPKGDEA